MNIRRKKSKLSDKINAKQRNAKTHQSEAEESEDLFRKRLDKLKELRTFMRTTAINKRNSSDPDTLLTLVSAAEQFAGVYSWLIEIYEMLSVVDKKIDEFDIEVQKHKSTWDYMQQAMEHTKETIKSGK